MRRMLLLIWLPVFLVVTLILWAMNLDSTDIRFKSWDWMDKKNVLSKANENK